MSLSTRFVLRRQPEDIDPTEKLFEYQPNGRDHPNGKRGINAYKLVGEGEALERVLWVYSQPVTFTTPDGGSIDAGMGLFAGRRFVAGETIGFYCGEVLENEAERKLEYRSLERGYGSHILQTKKSEYRNGAVCVSDAYVLGTSPDTNDMASRYKEHGHPNALIPLINGEMNGKPKQNVEFVKGYYFGTECKVISTLPKRAAKKPKGQSPASDFKIEPGTQLIASYGKDFFAAQEKWAGFWAGIPLQKTPTDFGYTPDIALNEMVAHVRDRKLRAVAMIDACKILMPGLVPALYAGMYGDEPTIVTVIFEPASYMDENDVENNTMFTFLVITYLVSQTGRGKNKKIIINKDDIEASPISDFWDTLSDSNTKCIELLGD